MGQTTTHLLGDDLLPACGAPGPGEVHCSPVEANVTCAPCQAIERPLREAFDSEAFRAHLKHDGEGDPDGCDYCFVRPMLVELHALWTGDNAVAFQTIWAMQDGYGEAGYTPEQGYDWSGVRDSTPATIREMWKVVHA